MRQLPPCGAEAFPESLRLTYRQPMVIKLCNRQDVIDDVIAVLDLADQQLSEIVEIYEQSLAEQVLPPRLQALVKNVLENQRSALEYAAHAITSATAAGPQNVLAVQPYTPEVRLDHR